MAASSQTDAAASQQVESSGRENTARGPIQNAGHGKVAVGRAPLVQHGYDAPPPRLSKSHIDPSSSASAFFRLLSRRSLSRALHPSQSFWGSFGRVTRLLQAIISFNHPDLFTTREA